MPTCPKSPIRRGVRCLRTEAHSWRGFPVLVVLCVLAVVAPARATTIVDASFEHLAKTSDVIAIGRVARLQVLSSGPSGLPGIHTLVEIEVEEYVAGEGGSTLAVWVQGGRLGDRWRVVPGQAVFRAGEEVAVFLFRDDAGNLWPNGMGLGKWGIASQGVGGLVAPPAAGQSVLGQPDAVSPSGMTRQEFRAWVQRARS